MTMSRFSIKSKDGFTLVEMLIVTAIIGVLSGVLIVNFRTSNQNQAALQRGALELVSEIRRIQTMSTVTNDIEGNIPCGFGIHHDGPTASSFIYTYFDTKGGGSCSTVATRNYVIGDTKISDFQFSDSNMEFKSSFLDVFFEPPNPKTYIDNNSSLVLAPMNIQIGFKGGTCAADCIDIQVYTSGRIEIL
jgi:prepilin-type N-terminal cleavage/methylation domain-containing protein